MSMLNQLITKSGILEKNNNVNYVQQGSSANAPVILARGIIVGLGPMGYALAIAAVAALPARA